MCMQERVALLAGATTPNAGRRPQPFVMHKMAFHRGRALGIIRRTLHSSLPANAEAQAGACTCLLLATCCSPLVGISDMACQCFSNSPPRPSWVQHLRADCDTCASAAESGGVLKDAIFDDVLALKQPSATWPRPVAVCAPNALGNVLRQRRLRQVTMLHAAHVSADTFWVPFHAALPRSCSSCVEQGTEDVTAALSAVVGVPAPQTPSLPGRQQPGLMCAGKDC